MTFLSAPQVDDQVQAMYDGDVAQMGFVMNLSAVWAHLPDAHERIFDQLGAAAAAAGLSFVDRGILVVATATTIGDSYCSLAWGRKLTDAAGVEVVRAVLTGDDGPLDDRQRALATWARKVAGAAVRTTEADVEALRAAGFDETQIVAVTVFVAQRMAFSTVNAALGAAPDAELGETVDPSVRAAVTWGRPIAPVLP
jgi:uncharacterized peroxidase-related enzyme